MNPSCSRCKKIVYPVEKVNCLDKFWHKSCFSCEECNMTLNMKNYKGFDKKPYCTAHYPKSRFTPVVDTPENLRLKQLTENQSQIRYRAEAEKNKGRASHMSVDTPEMKRVIKTQSQVSNIKYHEEYEKRKMGGEAPRQVPSVSSSASYQTSAAPQNYHFETTPEPAFQVPAALPPCAGGKRYRAVYDYSAADSDEVSFMDGDVIVDVQQIDEGWMYGCVERTGQRGMLPANYVEAV